MSGYLNQSARTAGEAPPLSDSAREGGMHAFIAFAHALSRVPGLKRIKGMILTGSDAETQTQRKRLAALLEAQGAHWVEEDGERWLIYPLQRDDVSYH